MEQMKLENSGNPKMEGLMTVLMPTLLSFGLLFMVIGLNAQQDAPGRLNVMDHVYALVGALALTFGLTYLYIQQVRILRRLHALEKPGNSEQTRSAFLPGT